MEAPSKVHLVQLLLSRLERISVDSYWAHRASGIRGAIIKKLDESDIVNGDQSQLDELITTGFAILYQAAKENDRGGNIPNRISR
jgi:hypothetical protein